MGRYQFNNTGLKLFDLLSFALAIEPKNRQFFIQNLGEDIWDYYYSRTHQKLEDILYSNISHHDFKDKKSYDVLKDLLMGNTRINQHGRTIGDTAAVEDMRNILKILDNPNDIEGQKFLFGLLKEWEKLPKTERDDFDDRFSKICESFLMNKDNTFRISDPKMKKDLLFMIADNAKWMDRFLWYEQMLKQDDLNFDAKEMQSLYNKMLESEAGFVQHYERKAVNEYRYEDRGKAEKYAKEMLKKAKERLDKAVAQEQEKQKTQEIKQEQQPDLRSEQEQPVKEEPKSSIKVTKVMTYDDLIRENESLKKQVEYWKSLYSMQRANASGRTTPVMQRNPYEKN